MKKVILSLALVFFTINVSAQQAVAPVKLKTYDDLSYYDYSYTILSSSKDTSGISIAQKDERIYFYIGPNLIGKPNGYDQNEVRTLFSSLAIPKQDPTLPPKVGVAASAVTALVLTFIVTIGSSANEFLSKSFYSHNVLIATGVVMLLTSLASGLAFTVNAYIVEKKAGKPVVYKKIADILQKLGTYPDKISLNSEHESRYYSQYVDVITQILDRNAKSNLCASFFGL